MIRQFLQAAKLTLVALWRDETGAVSAKVFSNFPLNVLKKTMNLSSDTIKVMLTTSSYTPNQNSHDFKDDVTNEVSGTGYSAGGAAIGSPAVTVSTTTTKFDGDDVQWTTSTITARYAVIYDDTPSGDGNKPLIAYVDFGENKSSEAGTFKLTWSASGIVTITVA